jgi:hypothetical protein
MPSSLPTTDNCTTVPVDGREIRTLRDILPEPPGLKVLFVSKFPAQVSVDAGHYFQGIQGKAFWNRLRNYGFFNPTTEFEDDSLLDHGFGIANIIKVPGVYGKEPSRDDYKDRVDSILKLVHMHRPPVIVFVYKKVLDEVLRHFNVHKKSFYGFNPDLEHHFCGARVFVFPMPGTPCTKAQTEAAMRDLAEAVGHR